MAKRGRGTTVTTTLVILDILRNSDGMKPEELRREVCRRLGLDPSKEFDRATLYRYLKTLENARFALVEKRGAKYVMPPSARKGIQVGTTLEEMLSIYLAINLLDAFEGTPITKGLLSLWTKFFPNLTEQQFAEFEALGKRVTIRGRLGERANPDTLVPLLYAIQNSRTVKIEYEAVGFDCFEGSYDPYGLVLSPDGLYLVADSHYRRGRKLPTVVLLKLARMRKIVLTDKRFREPKGFTIDKYLSGVVGVYMGRPRRRTYRIRLTNWAAQIALEAPWHDTQKLAPDGANHQILSLTLDYEDEQLTAKILALGTEAEVLEPSQYRLEIAEQVEAMAGKYRA